MFAVEAQGQLTWSTVPPNCAIAFDSDAQLFNQLLTGALRAGQRPSWARRPGAARGGAAKCY